jgi:hypothetical protein
MTQNWHRDDGPCIELGAEGAFDDMHLFGPCVAFEDGTFFMWYSGSRGTVDDRGRTDNRAFTLGRATSEDGIHFSKDPRSPVCRLEGTRSILTPTLLRHPDGSLCREDGRLRLWFASCDFPAGNRLHTLHETTSEDGINWTAPSDAQLENAYAPTLLKEGERYKLWYTDVEADPWSIRYAESGDGRAWEVAPDPVVVLDQSWERQRLVYPTVLKIDGRYWMWYGSYSQHGGEEMKTALGCAYSDDGITWQKDPDNPVFGPDPSRAWESHYTTSQSVLRLAGGSLRIWYAARPAPPFEHKYFAVGTARWKDAP